MLIELRKKAQITIPKEIVIGLGLTEGDTLDVRLVDGVILIEPVTVYRKTYVRSLERELGTPTNAPDKYGEGPKHHDENDIIADSNHDERKGPLAFVRCASLSRIGSSSSCWRSMPSGAGSYR